MGTLTKELDALCEFAKDVGRQEKQAEIYELLRAAHNLLIHFGSNLKTWDYGRYRAAEELWEAIHKIGPSIEMPAFIDRGRERVAEARVQTHHIAEDHGVPGGDRG